MPADVFLSYSRRDSGAARSLAESLRGRGLTVWLDTEAIDGAANWSKEIAEAILDCRALLVLLSKDSVRSPHVTREITIAAEREKTIVPIDVEPVPLPVGLLYPLAGLQRIAYSDQDALCRTLHKLGIQALDGAASAAPALTPMPPDAFGRKTLAVLPFENLRRDPEDQGFAAGLTQELINVLSQIKMLRVKDRKSVMNYDTNGKALNVIADELGVQYVLEGTVRKQEQHIRITAEFIDVRTEDHLWSNTFKGTLEDIFEIQERVALDIAEALKLTLTLEEKSNVAKRLTDNLQAYELYLKAEEQMGVAFDVEFYQRTIDYLDRSLALDPRFTEAWILRARTFNGMVTNLGFPVEYCNRARESALRALLYYPHSARAFIELAQSYLLEGQNRESEDAIERATALDPEDYYVIWKRGIIRGLAGRHAEAVQDFELAHEKRPDDSVIMLNAITEAGLARDAPAMDRIAKKVFPILERYIRLHPEECGLRTLFAGMLVHAGRVEDGNTMLESIQYPTTMSQWDTALVVFVFVSIGQVERAIDVLMNATRLDVARRYAGGTFLDALQSSPRYELVRTKVEGALAVDAAAAVVG